MLTAGRWEGEQDNSMRGGLHLNNVTEHKTLTSHNVMHKMPSPAFRHVIYVTIQNISVNMTKMLQGAYVTKHLSYKTSTVTKCLMLLNIHCYIHEVQGEI
jgi:hypothetical protein